jgi:hypothetical protein
MSHAACSGSPRAHTFACILCPVPTFVTSILILYHFLDDIRPTLGVFVYDPAGAPDIVPQNWAGPVPLLPHRDMNNEAGFVSIEAVTPMDLPAVPVRPFDLTSICASAPLYAESSM